MADQQDGKENKAGLPPGPDGRTSKQHHELLHREIAGQEKRVHTEESGESLLKRMTAGGAAILWWLFPAFFPKKTLAAKAAGGAAAGPGKIGLAAILQTLASMVAVLLIPIAGVMVRGCGGCVSEQPVVRAPIGSRGGDTVLATSPVGDTATLAIPADATRVMPGNTTIGHRYLKLLEVMGPDGKQIVIENTFDDFADILFSENFLLTHTHDSKTLLLNLSRRDMQETIMVLSGENISDAGQVELAKMILKQHHMRRTNYNFANQNSDYIILKKEISIPTPSFTWQVTGLSNFSIKSFPTESNLMSDWYRGTGNISAYARYQQSSYFRVCGDKLADFYFTSDKCTWMTVLDLTTGKMNDRLLGISCNNIHPDSVYCDDRDVFVVEPKDKDFILTSCPLSEQGQCRELDRLRNPSFEPVHILPPGTWYHLISSRSAPLQAGYFIINVDYTRGRLHALPLIDIKRQAQNFDPAFISGTKYNLDVAFGPDQSYLLFWRTASEGEQLPPLLLHYSFPDEKLQVLGYLPFSQPPWIVQDRNNSGVFIIDHEGKFYFYPM